MDALKIVCTKETKDYFTTTRSLINAEETDFTDVAAVVVTEKDIDLIKKVSENKFGIPLFIVPKDVNDLDDEIAEKAYHVMAVTEIDKSFSREIETAARNYEDRILPHFFKTLSSYVDMNNAQFDCPGHQGGQYYRKHPAGRALADFFGENIFRADICNADVALGDLLIHEGPPEDAQKYAARVYNADKTYFVMNGTSTSNAIAINAVVAPGELILFDRNNHKSVYNAGLIQSQGVPV
ncbi:MAG: Orn/Lys/Arg decarboxylase N-terminal domain-containing protein, partial [Eubacteriales bacterium]|nr:Orn/Lys/Arg decarboxylase N-terminal domain-containing protein [Eubacteriales bacterium]